MLEEGFVMFFVFVILLLVISYVRPVHHNIRDDLGRELREFGYERGDEARQMRLFVFFDTSGVIHFFQVRK